MNIANLYLAEKECLNAIFTDYVNIENPSLAGKDCHGTNIYRFHEYFISYRSIKFAIFTDSMNIATICSIPPKKEIQKG